MPVAPNDHGTRHDRFPHPNPLPGGEGANESLREFHVDAETRPSEPQASHGGLHILLAEDNPDNVLLIEVFLKQTAHRIDLAEDGLAALEKFRANRYDVVLMDVQMPRMGGYEATAEIRRIEEAEGRTPIMIIALTAHARKEDEQRSFDAGCNGHLTKPIKKKVLLEALQSIPQFKPSE
jgi:CheY-like chemotaxis protein